jgi:SseB protein N-terminal domain
LLVADADSDADADGGADSAGTPWAGRHFEPNDSADDDGSAPEHLIDAIRRFRAKEVGEEAVVDAFRTSRLLIPLIVELGDSSTNDDGQLIDKTQELSLVTVAGPDGRTVLPAFSSVETTKKWNPLARPVPADGVRVALAAASESTDIVVLDATSETEFVFRRPALWAIAQSLPWIPSYRDPVVLTAFAYASKNEPAITSVALAPGDPEGRYLGPELTLEVEVIAGLGTPELDEVFGRMGVLWGQDEVIAARVDSVGVRLTTSPTAD